MDEIPVWAQHKSPKDVAERHFASNVGRKYTTDRQVLNADNSLLTLGTLQLILQEMREHRSQPDALAEHVEYMKYWFDDAVQLVEELKRVQNKLSPMLGVYFDKIWTTTVPQAEREHRRQRWYHWYNRVKEETKAAASIKCVDDLINLRGIGPKTLEKIKADLEADSDD